MTAPASKDIVLPDVVGQIKEAIAKEIRVNQPMSNWASKIGHPCARFLVHARLDWKQVAPITVEKKMMFDLGHVLEQNVAKVYLEKGGFDIVEMDRPIQAESSGLLQRVKIHGRMDFIVRDRKTGFEFPVEVKGISPISWNKIESLEDMLFSKHFWMRQYPGQLMIYLLGGSGYEVGMFLLINKLTAEPKVLWVHQDYTYAEDLIKKAEIINKHVDAGTYPDRIPYDDNICGRCEFASVCLKDVIRTETDILTDDVLIDELSERETLKNQKTRYDELDKSVKSKLKGIKKAVAGDFLIIGKEVHRDGYTVEASDYFQTSIKSLVPKK
jgi:CRISPR/Cas system-associated exonuclease Cas4 (RecB family)